MSLGNLYGSWRSRRARKRWPDSQALTRSTSRSARVAQAPDGRREPTDSIAAGASVTGIASEMATAAESFGGAKVVFVLFRRGDLTRDQCMAEWSGNQHTSIVRKVPGLKRWIQNHTMGSRNEGSPDGIGELWFETAETMDRAMKSTEMSAAVEDAKRFLDMTRTYAIVVNEKTIVVNV